MTQEERVRLTNYLGDYVSEHKKSLIEEKLIQRTRFITVVLEDIFNPHNASAVIRSCDCFGIQDLHVIEQRNQYRVNPGVTRGGSKWVDLFRYNNPDQKNAKVCLETLKKLGYRIVAVTPDPASLPIKSFQPEGPIALVFGTEMEGLTDYVIQHADNFIRIPMKGFTGSFNVSVCVALCLYELTGRLESTGLDWHLDETQITEIRLNWYRKVVNRSDLLEKEFIEIDK